MNIYAIEELMYRVSDIFLAPVLIALLVLFVYALFSMGMFFTKSWQRNRSLSKYKQAQSGFNSVPGYELFSYYINEIKNNQAVIKYDDLEVYALKKLEKVRLVTRVSPMLGLIATMIPMGPALKSLADGNIQGISDNLVIAFSSVIFGLVIATVTFWIATVEKRWLAVELLDCQKIMDAKEIDKEEQNTTKPEVMHAVS